MRKRVAIIGGGIYGVTIAISLGKDKNNQVDLYEQQDDILKSASAINQYRLHRGYHYPRSYETAISSLRSEPKFTKEYKDAVMTHHEHYYCIAKQKSFIDRYDYLAFCDRLNLSYKEVSLPFINKDSISLCIKVDENLFDYNILKMEAWKKLKKAKVSVYLNTKATKSNIKNYDFIIICTYARMNEFLKRDKKVQKNYQFELCEKPVVRLPSPFHNKGVVVMDGPFLCLDPYGNTKDLFVLGNVVQAIHATNIGKYPKVPQQFRSLLNNGIVKNPPITRIRSFLEAASYFFPEIAKAQHIGSMYTIRAVLPNKDKTDERPTLVQSFDKKIITVFSGKISNCIEAAEEITGFITAN